MAEAVTTSATDFKQHVGKYLDVARTGAVIIEKQGRPTAVLISVEEYEALNPSASRVIDRLTEEFDTLVARMQRRGSRRRWRRRSTRLQPSSARRIVAA